MAQQLLLGTEPLSSLRRERQAAAGGGGHTRYQQMVLQNMEWPLEVLKGCGAFEVVVLQMAALCSAVTQQLCQPPLQRSADADWLFWKYSALFCIKNLRKQTKEHVAWAQVQVRVLWQDSRLQLVLKQKNMRSWVVRAHSSPGCHQKWWHVGECGGAFALCCWHISSKNTQITFTFVSFLPLCLRYKWLWCAAMESVQHNIFDQVLLQLLCKRVSFFFKPLLYTWKRNPMPQVKWINVL